MSRVSYLPEDGVATLDRAHLEALLAIDAGQAEPGHREALETSGLVHDGTVDPRARRLVATLNSPGPSLLLQTRAKGRLRRTTMLPRPAGTALVTRLPDDEVYHLTWVDAGALGRHLARKLGLGPHVLAVSRLNLPIELPRWDDVRAAFETRRPSGWAAGVARAELHELRWREGDAAPELTALVLASLDGYPVTIEPVDSQSPASVVEPTDVRRLWRQLCSISQPDWRPRPDPRAHDRVR